MRGRPTLLANTPRPVGRASRSALCSCCRCKPRFALQMPSKSGCQSAVGHRRALLPQASQSHRTKGCQEQERGSRHPPVVSARHRSEPGVQRTQLYLGPTVPEKSAATHCRLKMRVDHCSGKNTWSEKIAPPEDCRISLQPARLLVERCYWGGQRARVQARIQLAQYHLRRTLGQRDWARHLQHCMQGTLHLE